MKEESDRLTTILPILNPLTDMWRSSITEETSSPLSLIPVFRECQWVFYYLTFEKINKKTTVSCVNQDEIKVWTIELDESKKLIQHAIQYFEDFLQTYQHTVKKIVVKGWNPVNFNFGVRNLKNLEELIFQVETNYEQFISKLRKPLKKLIVFRSNNNRQHLTELPQIYQVQDKLYLPSVNFSSEDFLRLRASNLILNIGSLTEIDVFKIIRSWQNGSRKLQRMKLIFEDHDSASVPKFDIAKVLQLLKIYASNPNGRKVRIDHDDREIRRFASVCYAGRTFEFREESDAGVFEQET